MKQIYPHYNINKHTMALLPVANFDYNTIVLEKGRTLYVQKTPLQLIKDACLDNCSTYEGRRAAVMHNTGFKRKIPIPINTHENLYAFPTESPDDFSCKWIMHNQVLQIKKHPQNDRFPYQSIIVFNNGIQLKMEESCYVLEKQMERTFMCMFQFTEPRVLISTFKQRITNPLPFAVL